MTEELVSIIIPTYNRSEILTSVSVPSVINQTYQNWELIIVDDGSTDNTREICTQLAEKDPRIKYYYKENGGQGSARNFGLKVSHGEYVLFLDSDDALLSQMVEVLLGRVIADDLEIVKCRKWNFNFHQKIFNLDGDNPSCHIYRKNIFEKFGLYSESRELIGIEDADLTLSWHKYSAQNNIWPKEINLDQPLVLYLSHYEQATGDANLPRKKAMISALINKYAHDSLADKNEMAVKYRELGNLEIMLGDVSGRNMIKKSITTKFNWESLVLLIISYLGVYFYQFGVHVIKLLRENILWKLRIIKGRKKYQSLYVEAINISKNYKNWK